MPDDLDIISLTASDRDTIREVVKWYRALKQNSPHIRQPEWLAHAQDVYLARTAAGIAALQAEAGTGTDSSVGIMHKADCKLYRVDDRDPNIDVDPLGVERTVYNPSLTAVPANTLFLAVKTKDGKFIAVQLAGGSGDQVEVCEPAGDGAHPPKPKLMSYVKDEYILATDTVQKRTDAGALVWMRDANAPQP